jgi:hypothetical protein
LKEIIGGYRIAEKRPKTEFKRLTDCVIDFEKGVTILCNQCLAYNVACSLFTPMTIALAVFIG